MWRAFWAASAGRLAKAVDMNIQATIQDQLGDLHRRCSLSAPELTRRDRTESGRVATSASATGAVNGPQSETSARLVRFI
ncbi:hypothetical protein B7G68_04940 [Caulobacter segnis]|uniref:Uncharacterized protein n=1 Tax=Caulobacter segnis TaxID=88688 RepID=A0ABM6TF00_9CAUL|nr:hypothetical protein B7G68_04940 [Caulobacter segnis]